MFGYLLEFFRLGARLRKLEEKVMAGLAELDAAIAEEHQVILEVQVVVNNLNVHVAELEAKILELEGGQDLQPQVDAVKADTELLKAMVPAVPEPEPVPEG